MLRAFLLGLTIIASLSLAMQSYVEAAVLKACKSKCVTSQCGGKANVNADGTITGCRESFIPFDHSCAGQCNDCTANTVTLHCETDPTDTCWSDTGMTVNPCGVKTYFPCAGATYPNCTCNFNGGATPSTDACGFRECVVGGGGA